MAHLPRGFFLHVCLVAILINSYGQFDLYLKISDSYKLFLRILLLLLCNPYEKFEKVFQLLCESLNTFFKLIAIEKLLI